MARFEEIADRLASEILAGRHGGLYSRFMPVRELARRFSVSLTTAHKVVTRLKSDGLLIGDSTNPPQISPKVARHIAAADKKTPRRLGVLVSDLTNPFFSQLCGHVQRIAMTMDYQVLLASSGYDFQREQKAIRGFLEIGVEGLLVCPGLADESEELYRDLLNQGIPLAFISRRVPGVETDFVVIHNFAGGALVAGHLLSMGFDTFGYIAFASKMKQDVRLDGFRSALAEEGYELSVDRIANAEGWDIAHGYQAMAQLMESAKRPRAVFAFNDLLAIGAIRYCQEHGISVPGDVAIAGFDDLPESRVTNPPLTTIVHPVESMARLGLQVLLDRIAKPRKPGDRVSSHILLEPHLVVRQSTDPKAEETPESFDNGAKSYSLI